MNLNLEKTKKLILVLIILVAGFLAYDLLLAKPALITVVGDGKVLVEPSMVKYTVSILNSAPSANLALSENKKLVEDVVNTLSKNGVSGDNLQIAYPRVIPPTTSLDYQAVNTVSVTQKDINAFEATINTLYDQGVWSITDIVFTTDNSQNLEKQAIDKALADAKKRAKELAKSSGKRLGRIVSISTQEVGEAGALGGSSQKTNTGLLNAIPSQIEVFRSASIIYELK